MAALTQRDTLHGEIARLRRTLALRTEELRQIKDAFAPRLAFPEAWRLTPSETAVLGALCAAKGNVVAKEGLHIAITDDLEVETDEKIVDVFVCKLRRKLPKSIAIKTVWGEGYRLPAEGRHAIERTLAGERVDEPRGENASALEITLSDAPALPVPEPQPATPPPPAPSEEIIIMAEKPAAEPRPLQSHLGLSSALLNVPVSHPLDALVVIDAAIVLLGQARRDIVTEHSDGAAHEVVAPARPPLLAAPAKRKPVRKASAKSNRKPRQARAAATSEPSSLAKADVEVSTEAEAECVSYRGHGMEVTAPQAALVAMLAKALPNPCATEHLFKKLLPGRSGASAGSGLSTLASKTNAAIATLGLKVETVRGVGLILKAAEVS